MMNMELKDSGKIQKSDLDLQKVKVGLSMIPFPCVKNKIRRLQSFHS